MLHVVRYMAIGLGGFAALCGAAQADVFHLKSGGRIVGTLVKPDAGGPVGDAAPYRIQTAAGAVVTLPREAVAQREVVRPAVDDYEKLLPTVPDTAAGHWETAEWCRERDLFALRKKHLERVVELDPDHEGARRGLGHVHLDGKWAHPREVMQARGFVEHRGKWRHPQEVDLLEARRKRFAAEQEWIQKIELWRDWIVVGDKRAKEARERLSELQDPTALLVLHVALKVDPRPPVRMMFCEAMIRKGSPEAHAILMERAVHDPHREIRMACLEAVAKVKPPEATAYFIRMLRSDDNNLINNAAYGLGMLKDAAALEPLMNALVTQHRVRFHQRVVKIPDNKFSWGPIPNFGNVPREPFGQHRPLESYPLTPERHPHQNADVLDALAAISGEDFGFDKPTWKAWYAAFKNLESVEEVRRD